MADELPSYISVRGPQRQVEDSLFFPAAYAFPEVRDHLYPNRAFPLPQREDSPESEVLYEIQRMGLQFCVHAQLRRDPALSVQAPSDWDRKQGLWTDLPTFVEEPCEWHYPQVQYGYNVAQIEPPSQLRPENNSAPLLGYLPNGDLALYWEIAEALEAEFELEIEALSSSVDGRCLVAAAVANETALLDAPVGQGFEAGVVLSKHELDHVDEVKAFVADNCAAARVLKPNACMFYRLVLPVMQSEWNMNRYAQLELPAVSLGIPRLVGYSFRIIDNPMSRSLPIFATERGNIVLARALFDRIGALLEALCPGSPRGELTPVVRVP